MTNQIIEYLVEQLKINIIDSPEYRSLLYQITTREDLIDCIIVYDFDDHEIAIYPAHEENDNCLILLRNREVRELQESYQNGCGWKEEKEKKELL